MQQPIAVFAICEQCHTFKEGPAVNEVTPVREAWAPRTELVKFRSGFFRAFIAFRAPGHTHRAAAGIYTVPPRDRSPAALILMSEVAQLRAQVWMSQTHI